MTQFIGQIVLLAQNQPAQQVGPSQPFGWLAPLAVIMVLFYFMFIRPQKQKEQQLRDTVHNLKENDRIVTIGGIHGVVTNVQRDVERLTIRVDESTGAKLRVNMSAIARVLTGDDSETSAASSKNNKS